MLVGGIAVVEVAVFEHERVGRGMGLTVRIWDRIRISAFGQRLQIARFGKQGGGVSCAELVFRRAVAGGCTVADGCGHFGSPQLLTAPAVMPDCSHFWLIR